MTDDTMDRIRKEFPNLPDRLLGLGEMAENLWWSCILQPAWYSSP
ncbi:MAG: hypothetical protein P8Y04_08295 [Desulfobulbaceae bacterium]